MKQVSDLKIAKVLQKWGYWRKRWLKCLKKGIRNHDYIKAEFQYRVMDKCLDLCFPEVKEPKPQKVKVNYKIKPKVLHKAISINKNIEKKAQVLFNSI